MNCYFLVFARDKRHVTEKIEELSRLKVPYLIVCGEKLNVPGVVYRRPRGKYDAINFGEKLVPKEADVIALNDVDTEIHSFDIAWHRFVREGASLLFTRVVVKGGPQNLFLLVQDRIRRLLMIVADGDLMIMRRRMLRAILPLKPCKAEDTYILFKTLENRGKVIFCEQSYVETSKTRNSREEKSYKQRTVNGVYQALSYANPSPLIEAFYVFLPFLSPLLLVFGKKGYYWMEGILLGFVDYLRGDQSGFWYSSTE
jgi:cellulose synthase/poly-beta-1,6-N-acetylglucosamine synthase-like glycosyltransferase